MMRAETLTIISTGAGDICETFIPHQPPPSSPSYEHILYPSNTWQTRKNYNPNASSKARQPHGRWFEKSTGQHLG